MNFWLLFTSFRKCHDQFIIKWISNETAKTAALFTAQKGCNWIIYGKFYLHHSQKQLLKCTIAYLKAILFQTFFLLSIELPFVNEAKLRKGKRWTWKLWKHQSPYEYRVKQQFTFIGSEESEFTQFSFFLRASQWRLRLKAAIESFSHRWIV